ncbi:hypothetical protein BT96DRAFT_74452 [Gymnopus androsaceus JB14]|uniref:Uncharacterized protein n=1 Tax=Gymnopus androsaceus JB14 TaxID=1447944 RepID=A0A6A4HKF2_9AGAR|nr:hypothetical protein BT96DRAFT_74452 [Gymnopus androsaceus JB14]
MSLAGPVALASFGEAKEGMKAYKDRFIEESQMEGIKLLDSIREAVSNLQTVLSDTDLSDFELVYPDEDPVPDPKAQEEADLDELELVYPKSPTLSPSPALVPSQSEPIEIPRLSIPIPPVLVPSQCEPIQIPHLSIRLPPQASPMKSPSQGRHAFVIPANLDTPAHLYSSAPLPGSLAAYQESRNLAFPASASAPALSPQELVQSNLSHRPCCNSGCDGVVTAENSQRRCMGCVMKGWRSSDGTGQRGIKRKRKSKRVSWFDGYEKEGRDVINQDQCLGWRPYAGGRARAQAAGR